MNELERKYFETVRLQLQQHSADALRYGIGGLYGQHRQTNSQIYGSPLGQSGFGAGALAAQIQARQALLHTWENPPRACQEPVKDTGIEVGEVVAWRCWKIKHGWLYSVTADQEWVPGEIVKAHRISETIGDGVHAFKRRLDAIEYRSDSMVVGQVALWGRVYEFESGWHGEYAKIHSLEMLVGEDARQRTLWSRLREKPSKLEELRETYGL